MERIEKDFLLGKPNIVIASGISKEELIAIESRLGAFPNISIGISPKRDYLYGDAFAHLIGYIGFGDTLYPTVEGKAGVEDFYDDFHSACRKLLEVIKRKPGDIDKKKLRESHLTIYRITEDGLSFASTGSSIPIVFDSEQE